MLTPEEEKRAYEMDIADLELLAKEQLEKQFPDTDPNAGNGRNTENQGALGRFDGLIPANFRRPDSLDQAGEVKESEAPNAAFWTSSAVPGKPRKYFSENRRACRR